MHFHKKDCEFFSQIFKKLQKFDKFLETVQKFDNMHPMLKKHRWGHFSIEYTAKGFIKISSRD